ncbi:Ubiquitin carboxyl-terminal hydrolase 13 [Phytophthora pseudosyringae]|uniref:Ubiquitin carboxyl-terminal hydrolase n=1 Tax=Phytophthora pseudosyringae TaxID=221518 RepID=A0A8T1VKY0_9STRA|nr:Ubiquitin carboxyl-terminal hydrolase 13 [Phytophthora pseudosyringae]
MAEVSLRLQSAASHARVARASDRVYRDECVLSFDSALSRSGLYTNLRSFLSYGASSLRFDRNGILDASSDAVGAALYLHQQHTRKLKNSTGATTDEPPTKLAIGGAGGFTASVEDKFELEKTLAIVLLGPEQQELARVALDSPSLPPKLKEAAEAVLNHAGNTVTEEVASWQEELKPTKYAEHLEQVPNPPHIASNPAAWKCQAPDCDKQENLWLNLSDGYIGCGRQNWDGSGGCGAALTHFTETGSVYPLSVKLGTITAEGGDVYSYAPDEDDMVKNPRLAKHLEHFDINVNNLKKTDKSMNELQVGLNLSYEFDAVTEAGKKLVPVSGAGFMGFKNLGNSCYMNSVLQLLLALPEVHERYFKVSDKIFATADTPSTLPVDDFAAQFAKLTTATLTDRYKKQFLTPKDTSKEVEEDDIHNVDLRPITFRGLVGKGHPDFSTGQQQDAVEYLQYLLDFMTRAERVGASRLGPLLPGDSATSAELPTASLFKFKLEDRVQCMTSNKVKYVPRDDMLLQLQIPLEAADNATQVSAYQVLEQKRQRLGDNEKIETKEGEERVIPNVPFEACVEKTLAPEIIEDFLSPATGKKGQAQKTVRFRSFPRYLLVQMRRFYVAEDWTPKKLEVEVKVPEKFSLNRFVSKGLVDGEEELPEAPAASAAPEPAVLDAVDEVLVAQLVSMGFSENGCKRAAMATGNSNAEAAMEWIFSHMEDPDFNDPPAPAGAAPKAEGDSVNMEHVSNLMAMGFAEPHAKCALKQTDSNPDRAAEWLFSHMDDLDGAVAQCESESAVSAAASGDSGSSAKRLDSVAVGDYSLVGFVSHVGKNTNSGHYVCHMKKEGRWIIFNDDKVAVSEEPPLGAGYLYLFRRMDS